MASPVKAAKLHHQGQGFTEVAGRGRGHLLSRKPGTEEYAITSQVGGIGWHKGQGPFTEADEIDTAWVASGGLWDWEMTQADYRAYIRDSVPVSYRYEDDATGLFIELTASQPVWVNDEGQSENAASFSQVTPAITDDLISWANIAPGWSLRVQAQTARLAKFLDIDTLANLGAPTIGGTNERLRLPFTYTKSAGLTIWVDGVQWDERNNTSVQTSGDIEFRNGDTPVYWIKRPTAWDSDDNQAPVVQRVRRAGVNFYAEIDVPWTWLQAAVYPVTIDPTIDVEVVAGADDGYYDSSGSLDTTASQLYMGQNNPGTTQSMFARFTSISGLSGATINTAYMYSTELLEFGTADVNIYADDSEAPTAPTTGSEYTGKTTTTAVVNMTSVSSNQTPSIVSVIQELADSYDPSAIQLLIKDNGSGSGNYFRTPSYENGTGWHPELYIEYTAAASGLSVSSSESASVADTGTAKVSDPQVATPAEAASVADTPTARIDIPAVSAEAVTVADTGTANIVIPVSSNEAVGVADTPTATISDPQISAAEAVTVADSPVVSVEELVESLFVRVTPSANYVQIVTP